MNLTFRNLSLVLSFVLLSTVALAQGDRFNNEKIEAAKVTFAASIFSLLKRSP